jgi:diguanylate cyclase (GGDEF)-like protein
MSREHGNSYPATSVSLVGEAASSATYDEAIINCTDGYCIFDADLRLQAFSSDFPNLYPKLVDLIDVGMRYSDYLHALAERQAIQNLGDIENIDDWVESSLSILDQGTLRHNHHLSDGRWMLVKVSRTSTGQWIFIANDITEQHVSRLALEHSNQRFRAFAHLALDWFWELDADLNYVYHSSRQEEHIGEVEIGDSRIDFVDRLAVVDRELRSHNLALKNHQLVDSVLEWKQEGCHSRYLHIIAKPEFNDDGVFTGYLGSGREVTDEVVLQSRLNHLAEHDDLTGLINRRAFENELKERLQSEGQKGNSATLCFLDLDQFKLVNDGGGHEAGDHLLQFIAQSFIEQLGKQSIVARLGGDEFGLILPLDVNASLDVVNLLIQHVSTTPFTWNQRNYTIGVSAGLVCIDQTCSDISELMSYADTACYIAKNSGRNQAQIYMYDEFFQDPVSLEIKQANLLRDAMDNDGLLLYLQPIKPIQKEVVHQHFEVLLRFKAPDGSIMSAGEFITVAEKYDLVQHLDNWVLRESLIALKTIKEAGLDVSFSINLSGNSLNNVESVTRYTALIEKSGLSPSLINFEVTETAAIKNISTAQKFIEQMKAFGCGFSLDDFGSGMSSFGYLKELQVDFLKIDGSFVKDMNNDPTCRAIVSAFNQLSHELGMETVAEFVEDSETELMLREIGVDFVQGYGVGKPLPASEWVDFLLDSKKQA